MARRKFRTARARLPSPRRRQGDHRPEKLHPAEELPMKMRLVAVMLPLLFAGAAMAATPQQEKMKSCNAEAATKALKGDERKAFMKECLSAAKEEAKSALSAQQEKMKSCNADAKTKSLKGLDRKKFMSECLSK
jgi:hypothetical protein